MVVKNQLGGDFADLNETDQAILTEYNTLLAEEYQVLAKIQEQLLSEAPDADALKEYASAYVDVMDQRLADRIPYETGALLCLLMDELQIPNWQEAFNAQTTDNPVSTYSIIKNWEAEQ